MRILLFSLFGLFIFNSVLMGQNIEGNVYDSKTKEAIANIKITNLNNNITVYSDIDGSFKINGLKEDNFEFTHFLYKTKIVDFVDGTNIYLSSQAISLNEIVVKSDPMEDIVHSVIIADDIKKGSQMRNSAELFSDIPGFSIQKRSASAIEPSLRSFKYEEMNIKFDGCAKVINACPNRMDPITSHIIPEEIDKLEIIKGPYTVRFGQTFGGIVNMITSVPGDDDMGLHGDL
ncbi:MAG: TonB-dependent receptor plug domain-containing protein [Saprospiraceae bacterium]